MRVYRKTSSHKIGGFIKERIHQKPCPLKVIFFQKGRREVHEGEDFLKEQLKKNEKKEVEEKFTKELRVHQKLILLKKELDEFSFCCEWRRRKILHKAKCFQNTSYT